MHGRFESNKATKGEKNAEDDTNIPQGDLLGSRLLFELARTCELRALPEMSTAMTDACSSLPAGYVTSENKSQRVVRTLASLAQSLASMDAVWQHAPTPAGLLRCQILGAIFGQLPKIPLWSHFPGNS
jgi:hypothetical protein